MEFLKVERTEKKYEIPLEVSLRLKDILRKVLKEDKFNKENGYTIRSLYFDTFYNNDYLDKENGLENRRKIRLRTYDIDSEYLKLELKEKFNEVQKKCSLKIKKTTAKKLIRGDYSDLRLIKDPLAKRLYLIMSTEFYVPKVIIEYKRYAYYLEENNTRITIDKEIKSTESNLDIFSKDLILNEIYEGTVLEVKYNNFLVSYVKNILDVVNKREVSFSKYNRSRCISLF